MANEVRQRDALGVITIIVLVALAALFVARRRSEQSDQSLATPQATVDKE